jgi:DDE_Tnp_1-associated/Transposase DDE domain
MSAPLSLLETLAEVPDPRHPQGRRHSLAAVLSLAVLAMLSGANSYRAIAQFGRDKGLALAHALGFRRKKTPAVSTFSELFRVLDIAAFEAALTRWILPRLPPGQELLVCIDGKTVRGSKDGDLPGQHLVSAYAPAVQAVLAQLRVDCKTNEHKAALELLGLLPLKGLIVTGDAIFCQRDVVQKIVAGAGDYVFVVKDNQPSLAVDIGAGLALGDQARRLDAAFSPLRRCSSAAPRDGRANGGQGTRSAGSADLADDDDLDENPGLARTSARV